MKPDWEEWAKLVRDFQTGKDYALEHLLQKSRGIIQGIVKRVNQKQGKLQSFALDPDDIFQTIALKLPQNIMGIREPRYYPRWLKRVTENQCFEELKKLGREIRLQEVSGSEESRESNLNGLEDRTGANSDSSEAFQKFEHGFLAKDYEKRAIIKIPEIGDVIEDDDFQKLEWPIPMLLMALVDKEEYDYQQAEKKLRTIINFTDGKRLKPKMRKVRAKALLELGHLKMNEGVIDGNDGSLFYYNQAQDYLKRLDDKLNFIYATQQIGVSHYILGDPATAVRTYEAILREIPKSRRFHGIKSLIIQDLSTAHLAMGNIREADKDNKRVIEQAEEMGGGGLLINFARRQKAEIQLVRGRYSRAYEEIEKNAKDRPKYEVLEYVKDNILLFHLFMADHQENLALALPPKIQAECQAHLFHHQLQKLNRLIREYRLA